jgi:hypothetical protein
MGRLSLFLLQNNIKIFLPQTSVDVKCKEKKKEQQPVENKAGASQ